MIGATDCGEQQGGRPPKRTWTQTRNEDFDIPNEDSSDRSSTSEDEERIDGALWPRSGVHSRAYQRKMAIWKTEIKGKRHLFASPVTFRHSIWKYAIANRFDYKFVRNCKQRIAIKCKAKECPFDICMRRNLKMDGMYMKEFIGAHIHSVGDKC